VGRKLEGRSFTGDPENMLIKALEMDSVSTRAPLLKKIEERFPRAYARRDNFFI